MNTPSWQDFVANQETFLRFLCILSVSVVHGFVVHRKQTPVGNLPLQGDNRAPEGRKLFRALSSGHGCGLKHHLKINSFRHGCACLSCALCLAAALSPPAAAQEFGRLFFTPERRQALDRQRESNLVERRAAAAQPTLTIDGVVTRSGGGRTVWINGVAHDGEELPVTPSRGNPGRIVVRTPDGLNAEAGVGDTVNRNTGETAGLLGDGQIRIKTVPRR
jgi:hypothetical protein